jgi:hypothetical protein
MLGADSEFVTCRGLKIAVLDVTPEMAADWLGMPSKNRRVRQNRVREYVAAMQRGEWRLNGEAFKFDARERLVDGQHRAIAVVQSDVTITSLVIVGVESDAFDTMDSGDVRQAADVLDIHGHANTSVIASAARMILVYDWYGDFQSVANRVKPSKHLILQTVESYPALHNSVSRARPLHSFRSGKALFTALHFLFSTIDGDDADAFFDRLATGTGLTDGDPILLLRERMFANAASKTKMQTNDTAALTIKAWNAFREGKRIRQLRYTTGGASPEQFPTIN